MEQPKHSGKAPFMIRLFTLGTERAIGTAETLDEALGIVAMNFGDRIDNNGLNQVVVVDGVGNIVDSYYVS